MIVALAILVGVMVALAVYLILDKNLIRILFGFGLLNHATNLALVSMSGSPVNKLAPIVKDLQANYADPTPQALILTAIVIGFGVSVYMVVLIYKIFKTEDTLNMKEL